jgi:hypothetical protein
MIKNFHTSQFGAPVVQSRNMNQEDVEFQARKLVEQVSRGCTSQYEGTWTPSVYDTAWISMIQKTDGSWLFPESFDYILLQQRSGSGWNGHSSDVDGILNTMAALLAIEKHLATINELSIERTEDLIVRKEHGFNYLQQALNDWNVRSCVHVGFELIVPALLKMLESYGNKLIFPEKQVLLDINALKMKNFHPSMLYGRAQTTALHSLEAFIDMIDFTKLQHHKVGGSMMGSPSATAVYLMQSPSWDHEAEAYLRECVQYGGGYGLGSVPSAYPCSFFEFGWVCISQSQ